MPRAGYLILLALLLAAGAAGVLVWTKYIPRELLGAAGQQVSQKPPADTVHEKQNWMRVMNDVAASGGMALTFDETSIKHWGIAPNHKFERFMINEGGTVFVRLTSSVPLVGETVPWNEKGLSFQLPLGMATKTNGKKIEVAVVARPSRNNGSNHINIVYATQQAGNSGWKKIILSGEFSLFKFQYDVPPVADGYTLAPIVVLHADDTGTGRAVEILGMYIKILS